ncbi:M20/M25/M40 family metallo-hydrolase [Apibacter muscae]|uniref:M20/M25/M40 family metallo-hydrolase n=1 Tax=Apibacter muscae TaxID=2509004 RepID=A0A563DGK0_9FLAO|nr:M20/M25/M40 family metallo-hydrolase [Apibacter muscae]TWP28954.1 M20/M25/M40 family metallo-hydrolase [Apibacter muscae]
MKLSKIFLGIAILALVLFLILIIKTYTYPFKKIVESQEKIKTSGNISIMDESLQRLAGGIRIPTISTTEYEETNFKPFDEFKQYLRDSYPRVYNSLETTTINNYGLVFHWKGKNSTKKPILFLSHYDVVPVTGYNLDTIKNSPVIFQPKDQPIAPIQENKNSWDYSPFSGAVVNGRIYGRGTLDMKGMLFSILEAADQLLKEGFEPEQDLWFAFGHDEEVSGKQGAVNIAQFFKSKNIEFEAVYDEGGFIIAPHSILESIGKPMALVGVGEKGFLTLNIEVEGIGGHSSMPPEKSSLVYAAEIIELLNSTQMDAEIIEPINNFLKNVGGEMGFTSRMAIANQWLLQPVLIKSLSKTPASNALVRTTTAITMAKGSDAPNVLSTTAEITVNFRILPGNTVKQVMDHVENLCKGYKVHIKTISSREPSKISSSQTDGFKKIESAVNKIYPGAIISPYITIGGTDAYKYQIVSNNIYRFMPIMVNQFEQRTIHNENEHISIDNYSKMIAYFKELMQ